MSLSVATRQQTRTLSLSSSACPAEGIQLSPLFPPSLLLRFPWGRGSETIPWSPVRLWGCGRGAGGLITSTAFAHTEFSANWRILGRGMAHSAASIICRRKAFVIPRQTLRSYASLTLHPSLLVPRPNTLEQNQTPRSVCVCVCLCVCVCV